MIQVYTGNGKGKTTAALGLALRALGAGMKVYIGQFAKGKHCSEHKSLKKFKHLKLEQFGSGCFIGKRPGAEDIELARRGFNKVSMRAESNIFDLIILDEVIGAVDMKMIDLKEIIPFLKKHTKHAEIVLTGRCCPAEIIRLADLVSEIKEVKHYFRKGIKARKGIEI